MNTITILLHLFIATNDGVRFMTILQRLLAADTNNYDVL